MWTQSLLLVLATPLVHGAFNLTIIHTNDMHGRIQETSKISGVCGHSTHCYGGFARIKHLADTIKRREKNVLFLNAGDNFQGSDLYSVFKHEIISQFVDMLGIDVMSLGNHEFDEDVKPLSEYLKTVKTPTVCSNIDYSQEPSLEGSNLFPRLELTVGGTKIAVVGYITPDTKFLANSGKVEFMDEIPSIRREAREARRQGAKLVIALGHSGFTRECEIAEKVEEIDVVVGGHSHSLLYTGTPPDVDVPVSNYPHIVKQASGKRVPVVQAYAFTKYMGYIQLSFDDDYRLVNYSGQPILLDSTYQKDAAIEAALIPWLEKSHSLVAAVIGHTKVDLEGLCRLKECNFGNLVADALVNKIAKSEISEEGWTIGPSAIVNGGNIRAPISKSSHKGNITAGDLMTSVPFPESLVIVELTGEQLREVMEVSVERYSVLDPAGGFLQLSGIKVIYDLSKPPMKRVEEISVRCGDCDVPTYERLSFKKKYKIICSSYLQHGGDNYEVLSRAKVFKRTNISVSDALTDFIRTTSPIYPGEEGRVSFVNRLEDRSYTSSVGHNSWSLYIFVVSLSISVMST